MKMKKLVSVVLATTMMIGVAGCSSTTSGSADKLEQIKEAGKIVLGTSPDFPPNEFYILDENGENEIGVELEIKATDFNGVLANVQSGSVDMAISGFAQTEERKQVMQFSEGYQREDSEDYQGILTTKENAEKYKTLEEFKAANLTIAAQSGSIQYELAMKLTDEANIKQYGTTDASALALDAGDIDAVIVSSNSALPMLDTFTDLTLLPKDEFDLDPDAMYSTNVIGFPLGDEYQSLIDLCNDVIEKARENGDLEKWVTEAKELSAQAVEVEE